jgi:hypothetical protein
MTENKGPECGKEDKESARGGKLMKVKGKWRVASDEWRDRAKRIPQQPPGVCMDVNVKELREKGFVRI